MINRNFICGTALILATAALPAFSQTISNIDQLGSWQSCGSCAGAGGVGPNTPRSLAAFISSPSMDGASARFSISPTRAYSNALWWKQLGGTTKMNFVYDLYVYVRDISVPQALEFDMNQASGGRRHIFGTECDIKGSRTWRVWGSGRWNSTGIPCSLRAGQWNHIVWQFTRSGGNSKFIALTVNGATKYVNRTYSPHASSVNELNVAVQLDGNGSATPYSIWADKITMKAF